MAKVLLYDARTSQPLAPGPSTVQRSSEHLPWRGFLVEQHRMPAGERAPAISTHHMLEVLRGGTARGEIFPEDSRAYSYCKQPRSITLTPAGPVPRLVGRDNVQLLVCAFEPAIVEQIANDLDRSASGLRLTVAAGDPAIVQLIQLLEAEAGSGGSSGTLYAESLAHAVATRFLLLSSGDASLRTATLRSSGKLSQRTLQRVLDAMREQLADPPALGALASISGYTTHHFLRMFRAATGLTPHRYLLALRIERAQELLQHTPVSLIEIAEQTGFSSQAHLTTVFRQHTGETPGAWRRAHRLQFPVESASS